MDTNLRIKTKVHRRDLVYPELCYQIVGILFDVYNELGHGFDEKVYQKAVAVEFEKVGLKYTEQVYAPLTYKGAQIGKRFFDFIIDEKIVLEIKRGDRFSKVHMDQILEYLHLNGLELGILAYFSPTKLHYKRLVNLNSYIRKD